MLSLSTLIQSHCLGCHRGGALKGMTLETTSQYVYSFITLSAHHNPLGEFTSVNSSHIKRLLLKS